MPDLDVAALRARHLDEGYSDRDPHPWCGYCSREGAKVAWPCDTIRLLDALERAERVVAAARAVAATVTTRGGDGWWAVKHMDQLRAALADYDAGEKDAGTTASPGASSGDADGDRDPLRHPRDHVLRSADEARHSCLFLELTTRDSG